MKVSPELISTTPEASGMRELVSTAYQSGSRMLVGRSRLTPGQTALALEYARICGLSPEDMSDGSTEYTAADYRRIIEEHMVLNDERHYRYVRHAYESLQKRGARYCDGTRRNPMTGAIMLPEPV